MGDGPTYVLHRALSPLRDRDAVFDCAGRAWRGDATLSPIGRAGGRGDRRCEKKDLKARRPHHRQRAGWRSPGRSTRYAVCRRENLLPLGLSYDLKVKRDVPKGRPLTLNDVHLDEQALVYQLWEIATAKRFPPGNINEFSGKHVAWAPSAHAPLRGKKSMGEAAHATRF